MTEDPLSAGFKHKAELVELVKSKFEELTRPGNFYDPYYRIIEALTYVYSMGVQGDIAEFGTWTARSSIVIAESVHKLDELFKDHKFALERRIYFCDSFSGLPEITAEADKSSIHVQKGTWQKNSMAFQTQNSFSKLIESSISPKKFDVIKGYFSDTVANTFKNKQLGFIHCDVDLYSSTVDCLMPLFQQQCISPGCIILFDDWNCSAANPEHGQRKAFKELCDTFKIEFSDEGSYSFHGRSFIIHKYANTSLV